MRSQTAVSSGGPELIDCLAILTRPLQLPAQETRRALRYLCPPDLRSRPLSKQATHTSGGACGTLSHVAARGRKARLALASQGEQTLDKAGALQRSAALLHGHAPEALCAGSM
jgi:hypothetical protein